MRRPSQPLKGRTQEASKQRRSSPLSTPLKHRYKPTRQGAKDLLKRLINSSLSFYPFNSCQSAPLQAKGPTKEASKLEQPFQPLHISIRAPFVPPRTQSRRKGSLLKKRTKFKPPFQRPHTPVKPTGRGEDLHLDTLQGHRKVTLQAPVSVLSPYSRKPGLFGPNVSIFAKGVSKGVHNIAFLLSPDRFRVFDLKFFRVK